MAARHTIIVCSSTAAAQHAPEPDTGTGESPILVHSFRRLTHGLPQVLRDGVGRSAVRRIKALQVNCNLEHQTRIDAVVALHLVQCAVGAASRCPLSLRHIRR